MERYNRLFTDKSNSETAEGEYSLDSIKAFRKVLKQTSPIYPSLEGKAAVGSPEFQGLIDAQSPRILHLRCSSDAGLASERVRNYFDTSRPKGQMLLYFRFQANDIRFNNVDVMLEAFFSQTCYNRLHDLKGSLEVCAAEIESKQYSNREDKYAYLTYLRLNNRKP